MGNTTITPKFAIWGSVTPNERNAVELTYVQVFESRIKGIVLFISSGFVFLHTGSNEEYQNNI